MQEIWKTIKDFENYQISNHGRVKSLVRKERIMKAMLKHGYLYIGLIKNGKQYKFRVHRLVAEAFIPNPNNLKIVNHKNRIKHDNVVENLEWCSQQYNISHKMESIYGNIELFNKLCPHCRNLLLDS